jgi:ketosteroid isomerase-like protein
MKMFFGVCVLFVSVIASAEYYPALKYHVSGRPAVESDKAAIDKLMNGFWSAWSAQDAQAVGNTHSQDAEWTNAFGRSFRSAKELEVFLNDKLFPNFDKEVSIKEAKTYLPISRRYIGSSGAVIYGRFESDRGSSVGSTNRKIAFTFVLEKLNGEWKIVNQIITDLRERRGT